MLATGIPVQSLCEHHLLPFTGVAHIGYLPGDRILGLSKLARVRRAVRPRTRRCRSGSPSQVADWLEDNLAPRGVGVVIEAEHLCMSLRGVQRPRCPHDDLGPARACCATDAVPARSSSPIRNARVTRHGETHGQRS